MIILSLNNRKKTQKNCLELKVNISKNEFYELKQTRIKSHTLTTK